jgi:hypothetical protein
MTSLNPNQHASNIVETQSTYNSNTIEIQLVGNINTTKTQPTCIIPTPQVPCEVKFPSTQEKDMDRPIFGRGDGCCCTRDPLIAEGKSPLMYIYHFPIWSPKW